MKLRQRFANVGEDPTFGVVPVMPKAPEPSIKDPWGGAPAPNTFPGSNTPMATAKKSGGSSLNLEMALIIGMLFMVAVVTLGVLGQAISEKYSATDAGSAKPTKSISLSKN